MANDKVARTGVKKEKGYLYFVRNGDVWRAPLKRSGQSKGKAEKVADANVTAESGYLYFVDRDGDVGRTKRAVGGQKRKKAAGKAAKKAPAKKAPAKKPAKKPAKGKKR